MDKKLNMEISNITRCYYCAKPANQLCSKCMIANYCSKECQRSNWNDHKFACIDLKVRSRELQFAGRNALTPMILNLLAGYAEIVKGHQPNTFYMYNASQDIMEPPDETSYIIKPNPDAKYITDSGIVIFLIDFDNKQRIEIPFRNLTPIIDLAKQLFQQCHWMAIWRQKSRKFRVTHTDNDGNAIKRTDGTTTFLILDVTD